MILLVWFGFFNFWSENWTEPNGSVRYFYIQFFNFKKIIPKPKKWTKLDLFLFRFGFAHPQLRYSLSYLFLYGRAVWFHYIYGDLSRCVSYLSSGNYSESLHTINNKSIVMTIWLGVKIHNWRNNNDK